jgi:hypothetical protein
MFLSIVANNFSQSIAMVMASLTFLVLKKWVCNIKYKAEGLECWRQYHFFSCQQSQIVISS